MEHSYQAPKNEVFNMNNDKLNTIIMSDATISDLQQQVYDGKLRTEDFTRLVEENMNNKLILKDFQIKQAPDGRYWVRVPWKKGAIRKTTLKAVEQEILKHFKEGIPTLNSIYVEYKQFRLLQIKPATFRKDVKNFENYIQHSPIGKKPISELTIKDGYQWYLYCKKEKPDMKEKYFNNVKGTLNSLMNYAIDNQIIKSNPFEKLKIDLINSFHLHNVETATKFSANRNKRKSSINVLLKVVIVQFRLDLYYSFIQGCVQVNCVHLNGVM